MKLPYGLTATLIALLEIWFVCWFMGTHDPTWKGWGILISSVLLTVVIIGNCFDKMK